MKRLAVWLGATVAVIAVLAIAAALALPYVVDTPRIQSLIGAQASHALGRPVSFAAVSVGLFPLPSVILKDLKVAEDPRFGTAPFLTLERGELRLRLGPLLGGRVEFGELVLKKPVIGVVQDAEGRWNFASLGAGSEARGGSPRARGGGAGPAPPPLASAVKLENGVVSFQQARGAGRAAQTYRVEDLDLTLDTTGRMLAFKGAARVKPGDLAVKLSEGTIAVNGAKPLTEAALSGKVAIEGRQLKDLVLAALGPEPAVAGAVKGTLTLGGSVGSPRAAGDVALSDLAVTQTSPQCPAPKQRTLKIDSVKLGVAWENGQLSARPLSSTIAGGALSTNLAARLEGRGHAQLRDLSVKGLPLEKVLVDFLCQGYAVTGPLDLTGALSLDLQDVWNTLGGSGQLKIGPGKVVGAKALALLSGVTRVGGAVSSLLAADVPASLFSSPTEFDSITGTYQIVKGVVTTRDLLYTSRAMRVAVAGDYALASGRMNLDLVMNHGRGEIQAKVTGTASSPSIRVNPAASLRAVDPGKPQSGLQELLRRFR